jgi:hypothetical protein
MFPLIAAGVALVAPKLIEGVAGALTQKLTGGSTQETSSKGGALDPQQLIGSVIHGLLGGLGKK